MRERLTELLADALSGWLHDHETDKSIHEYVSDHLLAEGVVVPICKMGDKVYQTDGIRIYESTIREITYCTNNVLIYDTEKVCFDKTAIHKHIFLTKEEAEQALAEREGKG